MEGPMSATGTVTEINAGMATVVFKRSKACGDCHACASFGDGNAVVELENTLGAKKGDRVAIELHPGGVIKASLILYGIPLIALLAGVFIGSLISDVAAALTGLGFAAFSLAAIRLFEPRFKKNRELKPQMIRILTDADGAFYRE